jgi:hypothetical protein
MTEFWLTFLVGLLLIFVFIKFAITIIRLTWENAGLILFIVIIGIIVVYFPEVAENLSGGR